MKKMMTKVQQDGDLKFLTKEKALKKSDDTLSTTPKNKDISDENLELSFQSSLNLELEELLEKNSKRFFGGCGG